jgi:ribosomal protein L40E
MRFQTDPWATESWPSIEDEEGELKSALRCQSPECQEQEERGDSAVADRLGYSVCERCGARTKDNGVTWEKRCVRCGAHVDKLVGVFVPTRCVVCEQGLSEENTRVGKVCRLCRKPYNECVC